MTLKMLHGVSSLGHFWTYFEVLCNEWKQISLEGQPTSNIKGDYILKHTLYWDNVVLKQRIIQTDVAVLNSPFNIWVLKNFHLPICDSRSYTGKVWELLLSCWWSGVLATHTLNQNILIRSGKVLIWLPYHRGPGHLH